MFPNSQAFMVRKVINHRKFHQAHGADLCQGRGIPAAICLTSDMVGAGRENQEPAAPGVVRRPSTRRQ
jgi:hypothetical protein